MLVGAEAAEAVDGAGERELGGAQSGDEVATADAAALLERLEHGVHAGEPALETLTECGLTREHAVPLEQLQRTRVRGLGGRRTRPQEWRDERPAAGTRGRAETGEP